MTVFNPQIHRAVSLIIREDGTQEFEVVPLEGPPAPPNMTGYLAYLREERWEAIKKIRSEREFGEFIWDGSSFNSDALSQSRIQGAAQLAMLAQAAGQPFAIDWTLADNTVRNLSGSEVIAVGMALGVHIQTQHGIARLLRQQIQEAQTKEQIEAVDWPST
jgi:hypothetical protein